MDSISDNTVIREATRDDMPQVYGLIKGLANFERFDSDEVVKVTVESLIKDGFDTVAPVFKCFVAELPEHLIIGYAIYYTCYSTWVGKSIFLEDLYVEPTYRKNGIGHKLLLAVARIAYETGQRLDFHVLSWNPAIEFYKSLGATDLTTSEEWYYFRFNNDNLKKLFDE